MQDMKIEALPTKELFIDMLTRDIPLIPAIVDLVDNSADGARRVRGDRSYKNLSTRLEISPEEFRIADNCAGITVEMARMYAFRFGRASGMPKLTHSVGQFGVGMKRAIFKIGRKFRVESATANSRFVVEEDVRRWAKREEWEFKFSELSESIQVPEDERGTTVVITDLHDDVSESFGLENFKTSLKDDLQIRLRDFIAKGLAITVGGIPVNAEPLELLSDSSLAPAYKELRYPKSGGRKPVHVRLYAGLGREREPRLAGWHVFCNGRLILEADKTAVTGFGEKDTGVFIPGFHNQYNHLRGYAYFDSDDSGKLPWNTTKTGPNTDSAVYRATKLEMKRLMRPVVNFLNKLKEEKAGREEEDEMKGVLQELIEFSKIEDITEVQTRGSFTAPKVKAKPAAPRMQRIQYERPIDRIDKVKKALGVRSFKKLGEKTFDYYYNAEIDE